MSETTSEVVKNMGLDEFKAFVRSHVAERRQAAMTRCASCSKPLSSEDGDACVKSLGEDWNGMCAYQGFRRN